MSSTIFKITNLNDGFSRRLAFTSTPTWAELAGKLENIYGIRKDDLCVSYIDIDGDEIVLSSAEELDDYYKVFASGEEVSGQGDEEVKAIRFTVRNLSKVREGGIGGNATVEGNATTANDVAQDRTLANEEGARGMQLDAESESGDSATVSSVDSSDVEEFLRAASPSEGQILEFEMFLGPHHLHPFAHGRGRGRGPHHRGHFHGAHRGRMPPPPPFPPHFGNTHGPAPRPPFPPHFGPADMPMPPHDPHSFPMFGFGWGGRGGHRGHMGRGGRGGQFSPHGHMHAHGHEHKHHHHHHRHHRHHPHFGPMGAHVPPFPPMRGGFPMTRGVHVQ